MTVCRASGGKSRRTTRPGQVRQRAQARYRIDFFLRHQRRRFIQGKAFAPFLYQIAGGPGLVCNRLIGQLLVRQQENAHPSHRLLRCFARPLQGCQRLLFGSTQVNLIMGQKHTHLATGNVAYSIPLMNLRDTVLGRSISSSASIRAVLRQVVQQGPPAAEALFVEVEKELNASVMWGKKK